MTSLNMTFKAGTFDAAQVRRAAAAGVAEAAEALLTDANTTVPLDEATLQASGKVTHDPGALTSAVSYDTPYAVVQHEDTTLNHPQQGRAKWLEQTMNERARAYGQHIAGVIRKALG